MEVEVPEYSEYLLRQIPKLARKRSEQEKLVDILRACMVPSFANPVVRRTNINAVGFKESAALLISRGLIRVDVFKPLNKSGFKKVTQFERKIYTTTPRGRIAIAYWTALSGLFEELK